MKQKELLTSNYRLNLLAYSAFTFVAFIVFFLKHDWENFLFYFAIALAFDPFNASVKWEDRPQYQKVWLFLHLSLVLGVLLYLLFIK